MSDSSVEPDPLAQFGKAFRTYVVESRKLLYVSAPKNACTSLKWLIAELAGEDLSRFRPGFTSLLNTEDAIHRRDLFRRTPKVKDLDPEVRRAISPANGWFVFGVVRDPRIRLFSAWENKFLMRTPDYRRWQEEEWYPRLPQSAEDIVHDFAAFVDMLHSQPDHPLAGDGHFSDQTRLIRPDLVPYSRIYDVTEMATLLADLDAHLRAQGFEDELRLRRSNDTPLRANRHVFAEPVRSRIEEMYAADFANFGDLWDYARIEAAADWTPAALQDLQARTALHDRISQLLGTARQANKRAKEAERRAVQAERRAQRAQDRLARLTAAREPQRPAPGTPAARAVSFGRRVKARLRRLFAAR